MLKRGGCLEGSCFFLCVRVFFLEFYFWCSQVAGPTPNCKKHSSRARHLVTKIFDVAGALLTWLLGWLVGLMCLEFGV